MEFQWHQVSSEEKEEIKRQAKKLMENFNEKLEKIDVKEKHFENNSGTREQGTPWETDQGFKDTMFSNAPNSKDGFIVAEKGGWK